MASLSKFLENCSIFLELSIVTEVFNRTFGLQVHFSRRARGAVESPILKFQIKSMKISNQIHETAAKGVINLCLLASIAIQNSSGLKTSWKTYIPVF